MNKMIITISIMLMSLTLNAQIQDSTSVLASSVQLLSTKDSLYMKMLSEISDQIADLEPQRYKIYKTENMYNLLKLDTATGRIWQVQYGMNNYAKPMETPIDDRSLLMSSEKVCSGRFELYPTNNMYTFILLDTLWGSVWQVQWSTNPKQRFRSVIAY